MSDPWNPPADPICDCCGGEDLAADGSCADCETGDCGVCLATEPAEPDYDAVSDREAYEAAWNTKRRLA